MMTNRQTWSFGVMLNDTLLFEGGGNVLIEVYFGIFLVQFQLLAYELPCILTLTCSMEPMISTQPYVVTKRKERSSQEQE